MFASNDIFSKACQFSIYCNLMNLECHFPDYSRKRKRALDALDETLFIDIDLIGIGLIGIDLIGIDLIDIDLIGIDLTDICPSNNGKFVLKSLKQNLSHLFFSYTSSLFTH